MTTELSRRMNRRAWLSAWLQARRRGRQGLLPAPVLCAQYPSLAVWEWDLPNPARWNAYHSLDGGGTWQFDDWVLGSARQYAPDGGQYFMFIVGVDANEKEVTRRSNAVRPDDARQPLAEGLVQFYQPQAGACVVRSWNEPEALPPDPLASLPLPEELGAGDYSAGQFIEYLVFPYREGNGPRVYAGHLWTARVETQNDGAAVTFPAWGLPPVWTTGYLVLRDVDGSDGGFRDVTVGAGGSWVDEGTGWAARSELPMDFLHPPTVARALWCVRESGGRPEELSGMSSPLGGWAFDSGGDQRLARLPSEDLRRNADQTLAYWVCPAVEVSGVLATLRWGYAADFGGNFATDETSFSLGDTGPVVATGHQEGDWYLVVQRNDTLPGECRLDLLRQRDGAHFTWVEELAVTPLSAASDYNLEGLWSVLVFGNSWHWGVPGYGCFDRMGVWNRALSNDEVLSLFNCGLGWKPT